MSDKATGVESETASQIVAYLRSTPKAVLVLAMSFLSGHLWVYLFTAYFHKGTKGDALIKSVTGRTAVGLLWLVAVLVPYYGIKYRDFPSDYDKIVEIVIPTIVMGLFVQLFVTVLIVAKGARK